MKRAKLVRWARWPLVALGIGAIVVFAIYFVDWEGEANVGEFVVGLGTLLLAVGTFTLAREAKHEVEASERPYVVASPHRDHEEGLTFIETEDGNLQFWYRVWNIGRGPGVVYVVSLQEEEGERELITFSTPRAIAVGGVADFEEPVQAHTKPLLQHFVLRVYYQDGSRRTYVTTMHLHRGKDAMTLVPISYFMRRITNPDFLAAMHRQASK